MSDSFQQLAQEAIDLAESLRLYVEENSASQIIKKDIEAMKKRFNILAIPATWPKAVMGCNCEPGNKAQATECHNIGSLGCIAKEAN